MREKGGRDESARRGAQLGADYASLGQDGYLREQEDLSSGRQAKCPTNFERFQIPCDRATEEIKY